MENFVEQIKKTLQCNPFLPGEIAIALKPMYENFPIVYNHFQKYTTPENITESVVKELCDCYKLFHQARSMFFELVCDNYAVYTDLISVPMEHPCTVAMLIIIYISNLNMFLSHYHRIVKFVMGSGNMFYSLTRDDFFSLPFFDNPSDNSAAHSKIMDFVLANGLCVVENATSQLSINKYSMKDIFYSIEILFIHWNRLAAGDIGLLEQYILSLAHRGMFIMSTVGVESIYNMEKFKNLKTTKFVQTKNPLTGVVENLNVKVFGANYDFIRFVAGAPIRMLSIFRFFRLTPIGNVNKLIMDYHSLTEPPDTFQVDDATSICKLHEDRVRENLRNRTEDLVKIASLKSNLISLFDRCALFYGDVEAFVTLRNKEPLTPGNMVKILKPPQAQQAWMKLSLCINIKHLAGMNEAEQTTDVARPYHRRYTFAHHAHSQNVKISAVDSCIAHLKVSLRTQFCIMEQDFIQLRHILHEKHKNPYLVQFMGRMHVFYQNEIYLCNSIEQAILVWVIIVRMYQESKIDGSNDIEEGLVSILNKPIVHSNENEWNTNGYVEGTIAGL